MFSRNIEDYPEGIVLAVDKPYGWTSADVIRKIKFAAIRHFGKKNLKVGHAGTLDPLATGVLLVCIGNATKKAQELQDHDKQYLAGISFGATTPSYDLEKEIDRMYPFDGVTEESVAAVLPKFLGETEQVAPLFSAKSVDGMRAYEMARKMYRRSLEGETGQDFDGAAFDILRKSVIRIDSISLVGFRKAGSDPLPPQDRSEDSMKRINVTDNSALRLPHADILVACSKGTYIRALARDIGEALGTGAHLDSLRRLRSGDYAVEDACSLARALEMLGYTPETNSQENNT